MHLAAESHVDRSIDGPAEFIQTNIVGTYTLLEAARQYWQGMDPERKANFRFHHISTDEVYGDLPHPSDHPSPLARQAQRRTAEGWPEGRAPEARVMGQGKRGNGLPLFTEQTAYAPSSPYSASKASSDHLVRAWQRTYGLPVLITNCSNNYGPYHFPEKLIPLVILNALEGKPLPVYGKGEQIRDWLYVEDHARALYQVITEGKTGETYNIGGHNEMKNIKVVRILCTLLDELAPTKKKLTAQKAGASPPANYHDLITFVADRPGHDLRYAIDAGKIERELGWRPQETFESGIRKTVHWYLENRGWWQRVLRSEEHTSELQSRPHLVCRLLLEKKKQKKKKRNEVNETDRTKED